MQVVAYVLLFILGATLIIAAASRPRRSVVSRFELERRKEEGSKSATEELRREMLLDESIALKRTFEAVILVLFVTCSIWALGWLAGSILAAVVTIWFRHIAGFESVRGMASRIYEKLEPSILDFIDKHPRIVRLISLNEGYNDNPSSICSKEELTHIVREANSVLNEEEKKLIISSLEFDNKKVEDIMTPRGVVNTIASDEIIGPLVLSELHQTGHSRFPVIEGDLDHVVGVLHIKELLALEDKKSGKAKEIMDSKVYYINQEQTLKHALAAFLKTRHHLFVVVNGYRETAGVLTLEDVIEALIGQKIIDEYDEHDDLRAVAARSSKTNNNPPEGKDV